MGLTVALMSLISAPSCKRGLCTLLLSVQWYHGPHRLSKALTQGVEPTGPVDNLIFEGTDATLDDLVADTDRAILVTRFWYIRFLDPQTILLTGLTRDGVFWVEDGRIRHALRNFRFNESPIAALSNVVAMSAPVRVGDALVPALRLSQFTFSSASDAV